VEAPGADEEDEEEEKEEKKAKSIVDEALEATGLKAKKAEKWTCSECGAGNFAKAPECSKCGAGKPSNAESKLVKEREAAKEKVQDVMDKFLRLQADLQNYRRTHEGAMSNAEGLGKTDALRKLVPFLTEIEEALVAPEGMTDREKALFDSYSLLFNKFNDVFGKFAVEKQEVEVGTKFAPKDHLKVEEREPESDEQAPGTILEVVQQGWTCEGRTLIPSEVAIVAFPEEEKKEAPPPVEKDEDEDEDDDDDDDVASDDEPEEAPEKKKEES